MSADEAAPRGRTQGRKLVWIGLLVLLPVLVVASAPLWAGGIARGLVEERFDAERAGRLEIGALDLSWTGRQAARDVRLFDPEGGQVAEVSAEFPSLLSLAGGGGKRIGAVTVRATADLVADDEGRSNLERALASTAPPPRAGDSGGDSGDEPGALDELDLEVTLDCPRLTWSDARTRALGAPFEISDLRGRAVLRPGQPVSIVLDGDVSGGAVEPESSAGGAVLRVKGELRGLDGGLQALQGDLEARLTGLPTGLVDALAGLDGVLVQSLGESFDLEARASGGLDRGQASLDARGQAGGVSFAGELRDGVLVAAGPEQGLELRFDDPGPLLARYAAPSLPEGSSLRADGLALTLRELELPVPDPAAGALDAAGLTALLGRTRGTLALEVAQAGVALPDLPGGPLEVAEVVFGAELEPGRPLGMKLTSRLPATSNQEDGDLELQVDVEGLDVLVAHLAAQVPSEATGGNGASLPAEGWSARFRGHARGIETARVDELFGQNGLLVDAVGASSEATFSGVWPPSAEPFELELVAPGATLSFRGVLEDGVLVSSGDAPLVASLPLSPLLSERIVGPLVPLMVQLEKPPGAQPLGLSVTEFRLPLDGDLSKLAATVRLELGEVAFEVVPGLSEVLARFGEQNLAEVASLPPFELRIEQGLARYQDLAVSIEGHEIHIDGAVDLATRQLDLDARIPLALLGKGISRELDRVREYLDPNLSVPIELTGGLELPKVRIGQEFLSSTVKQAAQGAVKKGLFDLLEKELGKDR